MQFREPSNQLKESQLMTCAGVSIWHVRIPEQPRAQQPHG